LSDFKQDLNVLTYVLHKFLIVKLIKVCQF